MPEPPRTPASRIVVYHATHPVEAKLVRSWLIARGIDDVLIEDRVYRPRPDGDKDAQELYQHSGYTVSAHPDHASEARAALDEARAQGRTFGPDLSDLRGLG
ncbi:MAG: hypothetical protein HY286_05235 [Planctomycetes bacterium]|nr:hypothetical protein [Planctomycetota bacterium]